MAARGKGKSVAEPAVKSSTTGGKKPNPLHQAFLDEIRQENELSGMIAAADDRGAGNVSSDVDSRYDARTPASAKASTLQ